MVFGLDDSPCPTLQPVFAHTNQQSTCTIIVVTNSSVLRVEMWWRMPLATILLASLLACDHCTAHAEQRRDLKGVDEISSNDGDSSSIPVVLVTSFADDESLSVCRGNLLASKEEGKRFGPQHFSSFLDLQSRGLIRAPFLKLHAIFVLIFYTAACLSCFSETNDTECCVDDRAYIPFQDEVEPDTFYLILDFLCTNVDVLIDDLTTKSPALPPVSPTASPTTTPSVLPTGTPIDTPPSALPSNAPLAAALRVPLFRLSHQVFVHSIKQHCHQHSLLPTYPAQSLLRYQLRWIFYAFLLHMSC